MNQPASSAGKILALIGAILQLAPVIGILGTITGMIHAFSVLGESGVHDPGKLSFAIGTVLVFTAIGFLGGLIGWILMAISALGCNYRARWFFWVLLFTGLFYLILNLYSLIFGVLTLIFVVLKRQEFFPPSPGACSPNAA